MDLEEIQKAVSGAISAAISRAVGQPLSTHQVADTRSQQSRSTNDAMDEDQMEPKVERKYVTCICIYCKYYRCGF